MNKVNKFARRPQERVEQEEGGVHYCRSAYRWGSMLGKGEYSLPGPGGGEKFQRK